MSGVLDRKKITLENAAKLNIRGMASDNPALPGSTF